MSERMTTICIISLIISVVLLIADLVLLAACYLLMALESLGYPALPYLIGFSFALPLIVYLLVKIRKLKDQVQKNELEKKEPEQISQTTINKQEVICGNRSIGVNSNSMSRHFMKTPVKYSLLIAGK